MKMVDTPARISQHKALFLWGFGSTSDKLVVWGPVVWTTEYWDLLINWDCYLGIPLPHHRAPKHQFAPLEINMEPEDEGLEDDFPFQTGDFQVPAVNFPGCTITVVHWDDM